MCAAGGAAFGAFEQRDRLPRQYLAVMFSIVVRPATAGDSAAMHEVSQRAILRSAAADYTSEQLQAWARRRTVEAHRRMVHDTAAFVATLSGTVVGFATVALTACGALVPGEVDQLFVDPEAGGRGVARDLLGRVEHEAIDVGLTELVTHASWRAVPVFERFGFVQVEVESVQVDDQVLTRALMRKPLPARA
jgi:putative acetyltransferase